LFQGVSGDLRSQYFIHGSHTYQTGRRSDNVCAIAQTRSVYADRQRRSRFTRRPPFYGGNPHKTQFSSQLNNYGGGSVGVADKLNRGKLSFLGV
jgi:hypothetical protein